MKYAVVYSSKTGNTRLLAEEIRKVLPAEECLYFGDTNTDMRTGKAAGVDTVGVLWGFRKREELEEFHPKYLISSPLEICQAFEEKA